MRLVLLLLLSLTACKGLTLNIMSHNEKSKQLSLFDDLVLQQLERFQEPELHLVKRYVKHLYNKGLSSSTVYLLLKNYPFESLKRFYEIDLEAEYNRNYPNSNVRPMYYTFLNQAPITLKGEVNTLPSETIPDQAMTPAELLARFGSGQPVNGTIMESYDDVDNWDEVDNQIDQLQLAAERMDKADQALLTAELKQHIDSLRQQLQTAGENPDPDPDPAPEPDPDTPIEPDEVITPDPNNEQQ